MSRYGLLGVVVAILVFFSNSLIAQDGFIPSTWAETQKNKKGEILIYWFTSQPFIYEDDKGNLTGIEYEIFQAFEGYLREEYNIDLKIRYQKSNSFIDVYYDIRDFDKSGSFGVSSFSITDERKKEVNFVSPYMPDISVLISSSDVPLVENKGDFTDVFSGLTAITIKGSTYESDLFRVRQEWGVDFKMDYINSNHNILETISNKEKAFGFVDLPIYLIQLQKSPTTKVKRQNLLPIKREGYSFVIPKNSDWREPFNQFVQSAEFKATIENITAHYFDKNLYQFIEDFYLNVDDNVVLLTKEKEMQYEDLIDKSNMLEQETLLRNFLIIAIFFILIFMAIIILLYKRRYKNNNTLRLQAEQIAFQAKDIEKQKEQLEVRNKELTALNEEKNTLIKVLAHDLRSPINQIQGFSNIVLLETKKLSGDQINYLGKIKEITERVNKMIGKILDVDALESDRVNIFFEELDLSRLIEQVIVTFSNTAEQKDIQIHYFKPNDEEECMIALDRVYITQILENLLSNAIKFSNNHTHITVELTGKEESLLISIKDEGPGFTESDKGRLFKKFQQLSARPTSGEKSTGLGLSIVKKYVDLMKGQIWVESEEGKGATFFIEFEKSEHPITIQN